MLLLQAVGNVRLWLGCPRCGMKRGQRNVVDTLLKGHGRTYAEELGIKVGRNTPSVLFELLCMALLLSARIPAGNAMRAARALIDAGLTTAQKMADATWQQRVDVITWHGYKRYDESGSRMLGDTAARLLERYDGDLRRLREEAGRDVAREHKLLQQFSGIGAVGADIFLREVQVAWDEAYPYADKRVLKAARELGLGRSADDIARWVPREKFAGLAAALVRVDLEKAYDELREQAGAGG